jgi:hypothetical protein
VVVVAWGGPSSGRRERRVVEGPALNPSPPRTMREPLKATEPVATPVAGEVVVVLVGVVVGQWCLAAEAVVPMRVGPRLGQWRSPAGRSAWHARQGVRSVPGARVGSRCGCVQS